PGTVIEVDPFATIELTGRALRIPPGVTLRGGRRGLWHGAELWTDQPAKWTLLQVEGDDVRITGLLLTGTSASSEGDAPASTGINVEPDFCTPALQLHQRVIIDHNEMWKWTDVAVNVKGDLVEVPEDCSDTGKPKDSGLSPNVRVA